MKVVFDFNEPFWISCPNRRRWSHFFLHNPVQLPASSCNLVSINANLNFKGMSLVNFDMEQYFSLKPLGFPHEPILNDYSPVDDFFQYRDGEIQLHSFIDHWRPKKQSDFEVQWFFDFLKKKEKAIVKIKNKKVINLTKKSDIIKSPFLNTSNKTADYCLWLWTGDPTIAIKLLKGSVEIEIEEIMGKSKSKKSFYCPYCGRKFKLLILAKQPQIVNCPYCAKKFKIEL